ncbi:MAG: protein-L-isoaspartate(D-aspartate) O-methyltransferase [Chloroflexi bacterium]|nr:protein-L-isoaspartate(D-aspartate) O-methyltransferase [Chloroflexota bacterium]
MDFDKARAHLTELFGAEIRDKRVLAAILKVPRELFVPQDLQPCAYDDRPLSIGYGQTISQPFIVALMTQALELKGPEKVLEVGTGSGYQAAILAELAKSVYSVERIPELAESARTILNRLGYQNINIKIAGEEMGWKEFAPYDAIVVTAAAPVVHRDFMEQLITGGRLVIPVGSRWEQELVKITKGEKSNKTENLGGCRFVPLIGRDAWGE